MTTTTVIHGSALTSPSTARDVDAIYLGDRREAARAVERWAAERGLAHLPVDLRRAETSGDRDSIVVPTPFGEEAPYRVIAGPTSATVVLRTPEGLAARMRAGSFDLASFDAFFADPLARLGLTDECRGSLDDPRGMEQSPDWQSYVGGPVALGSALRHVRPEAWAEIRRERPGLAALIEALVEHGARNIHPDLLRAIGGQAGGSPQKHVAVHGGRVAPLYGSRVGPWEAGDFAAALRGEPRAWNVAVDDLGRPCRFAVVQPC